MRVNRERPHVLVLPEDGANRQMANGFLLDQTLLARRIQVLEEAGGWREVVDHFISDHVAPMDRYPDRSMVLLIDFDNNIDRISSVKAQIPEHLRERVYILGTLSEPEDLKRAMLRPYEKIGEAMAQDCREETNTVWSHDLLRHNADELDRLRERVRPILFPPS